LRHTWRKKLERGRDGKGRKGRNWGNRKKEGRKKTNSRQ